MTQEQIDMIYFERGYIKLSNILKIEFDRKISNEKQKYYRILTTCYKRFNQIAFDNSSQFKFDIRKSKMNN